MNSMEEVKRRREELNSIADQRETGITNEDKERFFHLLEKVADAVSGSPNQSTGDVQPTGLPKHSGHKAKEFLKEAKEQHAAVFAGTDLDWKTVNVWVASIFSLASKASKAAPEMSEDDALWLYRLLSQSLENGFALVIKEIEQ